MADPLSSRPNLNWLRNRVSDRLVAMRSVDPAVKRADAFRAVAREYGLPSWRALKAAVDAGRTVDPVERFKSAVSRGDGTALAELLAAEPAARAVVNAPLFTFDSRAVHEARRHPAVIDVLLAHGADLNAKSAWWAGGWGVLETADAATADFLISRGATVDLFAAAHLNQFDRVQSLLDADPSLVHAAGGDGGRPLHFAASVDMVDLLLDRGAEIDARDIDHESTAAQWFVNRTARDARVARLVERGAGVDIFMAATLGDPARLAMLDADPALADAQVGGPGVPLCPQAPGRHIYVYRFGDGQTPLEIAWQVGDSAALQHLTDRGTPRQRLLAACSVGSRPMAEAVARQNPAVVTSFTATDHARLARAAWEGMAAAVRLMLDLGFDPAAAGPDGGTALHCAAWQGRADLVELLLARSPALVSATDPTHGSTPLGWCCHGSKYRRNADGDYPAVARLLVAAGATVGPNLGDATAAVREVLGI